MLMHEKPWVMVFGVCLHLFNAIHDDAKKFPEYGYLEYVPGVSLCIEEMLNALNYHGSNTKS